MKDRVYTRIDTLRKYIDEMLLQNEDLRYRRCGYVHLYGVGMAAAFIALRRGFDPELAEMAGMQHWLRNPKEPIFRDKDRIKKLCKEFRLNQALCD